MSLSPRVRAEPDEAADEKTQGKAREGGGKKSKTDDEFTAVPFVGGDSDMGFGGGVLASWARVAPDRDPYLVRVEAAAVATGREASQGIEIPYTDAYLLLELPHLLPNRLKLRFRLSYTREIRLKYYGVGNASVAELEPREWALYGRVHPTVDIQAEYRVSRALRVLWGVNYTRNLLAIAPDSRLARDMAMGPPDVQRLLGEARNHDVALFSYGLAFDTRDDIVNATRGVFVTARVDLAPGEALRFAHRYARLNASLRGFLPLLPDRAKPLRLTLAARVVGDALTDGAPFYELGRYDQTSAIGGIQGVRGIPAQRYIGKFKLFSNIELRSELFSARVFGKDTRFGLTGFFDTGRVWSDFSLDSNLDGSGIGLKYGLGGGLRVAAGKSFILRLDVGWSKDARPIGAYLTSGQAF